MVIECCNRFINSVFYLPSIFCSWTEITVRDMLLLSRNISHFVVQRASNTSTQLARKYIVYGEEEKYGQSFDITTIALAVLNSWNNETSTSRVNKRFVRQSSCHPLKVCRNCFDNKLILSVKYMRKIMNRHSKGWSRVSNLSLVNYLMKRRKNEKRILNQLRS